MRITKKIDKYLLVFGFASLAALAAVFVSLASRVTYADSEDLRDNLEQAYGPHFVTFYDEGQKLIVKTDAKTVGDAVNRAGILLNYADKVEPGLDTEINADNFFINIYRAYPVMMIDGASRRYFMTAHQDPFMIAKEQNITIYDGDEFRTEPNSFSLEAGLATVYRVERHGGQDITEEVEIPFAEERIKDYNLTPGLQEVRQLGEVGRKKVSYKTLSVEGKEISREFISEEILSQPVTRIVAVGASEIEKNPLTPKRGRNVYTVKKDDGTIIERQETFYDLPMRGVMGFCGGGTYHVREDGVKVDQDGYILVAAELSRYPRCSIVETSLGLGKVYDTGTFAITNPEQFDIATDWTNRNGE